MVARSLAAMVAALTLVAASGAAIAADPPVGMPADLDATGADLVFGWGFFDFSNPLTLDFLTTTRHNSHVFDTVYWF